MKQLKIINKSNQLGTVLRTYGKGVYIPSSMLKTIAVIYASLPLFSAWLFALIPKIKGVWIRW